MPSPYRMSSRSTSFSIGVAASSDGMNAIWPFCLARPMSSVVSARMTMSWWAMSLRPHAQVPDDVVPLPAGLGGDDGGAVHQAVEDGVDARDAQAFVAGPVAAGAAVLEDLVRILGHDEGVVVQ